MPLNIKKPELNQYFLASLWLDLLAMDPLNMEDIKLAQLIVRLS